MKEKITIEKLLFKKKSGEKIVALTAYDYLTAKLEDEAGVDLILVGDSLGMVVLGYSNTLSVTMEDMIHHTKAVSRGVKSAWVVADMPFLSYGVSEDQTISNAGRLIQEGRAQGVKLEGGIPMAPAIERMVKIGIPVLGHIGMTPTHILTESGYHVQGKNNPSRKQILEDALCLQNAGVFGIVLECIPAELAQEITEKIAIPTIGIGAGNACDGQILVSHDILGIYDEIKPKFVKHYANVGGVMKTAFEEYIKEVKSGKFPGKDHSY